MCTKRCLEHTNLRVMSRNLRETVGDGVRDRVELQLGIFVGPFRVRCRLENIVLWSVLGDIRLRWVPKSFQVVEGLVKTFNLNICWNRAHVSLSNILAIISGKSYNFRKSLQWPRAVPCKKWEESLLSVLQSLQYHSIEKSSYENFTASALV